MSNEPLVRVSDYEVVDYGIDGADYFPGCGTDQFDHVATGAGESAEEALDDALEQIAMSHRLVDNNGLERLYEGGPERERLATYAKVDHSECREGLAEDEDDMCDLHFYLSIRYDLEEVEQDEAASASKGPCRGG